MYSLVIFPLFLQYLTNTKKSIDVPVVQQVYRWYSNILSRITGVLDLVHGPGFYKLQNTTFR
jgi:hypothetical protein